MNIRFQSSDRAVIGSTNAGMNEIRSGRISVRRFWASFGMVVDRMERRWISKCSDGPRRPAGPPAISRYPARDPSPWFLSHAALLLAAVGMIPLSAQRAEPGPADVLEVGGRRELFVDGFLVDQLKGKAELRLHHPEAQEVLIGHDAPWEGNMNGMGSTFKDGDLYRRYYFTGSVKVSPDEKTELTGDRNLCYEESDDGIHWRQPALGLHEFQGSKANNIIVAGGMVGAFRELSPMPSVFKDENPKAAADARYKAIFWSNSPKGLVPFKSPDGIHWSPMSDGPVNLKRVGASLNLAFWDGERGEYRAYFRFHVPVSKIAPPAAEGKGIDPPKRTRRDIRTATSKDFLSWSEPVDLRYVDSPPEELYWNETMPYHRAPHLFIGFPIRYIERDWSDSMRALPDRAHREMRAKLDHRFGTALSESLIMASRDGVTFKRWNDAFLRPGIERTGTWNYGHQFIAWRPVETKSALEGAPNELSFYAPENLWIHHRRAVRRYTLRLDGFVSAQAPMSGGELITKPLRFQGRELALNFATSAAGSVRVEIQDRSGTPVPGFTLADCPAMFGDTIERPVTWTAGSNVSSLSGQPVRLRFVLQDADVYAFQFRP